MKQSLNRTKILTNHLYPTLSPSPSTTALTTAPCISYTSPDLTEPKPAFDTVEVRALLDMHHIPERDWLFNLFLKCPNNLFRGVGGRVFVAPDYNQSMEQQRDVTMRRIEYLRDRGVFKGLLTGGTEDDELRKMAFDKCLAVYDSSLAVKIGAHLFLW